MDVDKIQRINNLAIELEKQGLASGREDAVAQARRIFNVEESTENSENNNQNTEDVNLQTNPDGSAGIVNQKETEKTKLSEDKISEILQKNSNFMVSTIKQFQARLDVMEGSIKQLNRQVQELSKRPVATAIASNTQTAKEDTTKTNTTTDTVKPQESHPRSGGYNDSDVSIEKFFYMGTK